MRIDFLIKKLCDEYSHLGGDVFNSISRCFVQHQCVLFKPSFFQGPGHTPIPFNLRPFSPKERSLRSGALKPHFEMDTPETPKNQPQHLPEIPKEKPEP